MYYSAYQQKVICLSSSLPRKATQKTLQKQGSVGFLKGPLDWILVKTADCPATEIRLNNCNPVLHHDSKNSQVWLDLSHSFVSLRNQTSLSTLRVTECTAWCWTVGTATCIILLPMYSSSKVLCTEGPQSYIHCLIDSEALLQHIKRGLEFF